MGGVHACVHSLQHNVCMYVYCIQPKCSTVGIIELHQLDDRILAPQARTAIDTVPAYTDILSSI